MKTTLTLIGVLGIAFFSVAADLKMAVVDLQQVVADYYKAQEMAKELKAKEVSFVREIEGLRLEGRKRLTEVEDLRRLSLDNALSASNRDEKKRNLETKLSDLNGFQIRYDEIKGQRESEFQMNAARVNRSIVEEVLSATKRVGDEQGFNLVLNVNKLSPTSSDVLFTKEVEDVTGKVLALLNRTRPAPTGARDEKGKQ